MEKFMGIEARGYVMDKKRELSFARYALLKTVLVRIEEMTRRKKICHVRINYMFHKFQTLVSEMGR